MIGRRCGSAAALILLVPLTYSASGWALDGFERFPIRLSEEQQREVLGGKKVAELMPVGADGTTEAVAVALMDSAPERLFEVLTANEKFAEFMPYVKASRAERQADGSIINHQELSLPFPIADRHYSVRIVNSVTGEGAERVWESAWTYVQGSGNINETRGAWVLTEGGPGKTLLLYRVFTDPGGLIPRWAYNLATRQSLPDLLDSVERRARELK
jgi:hypothetical protein